MVIITSDKYIHLSKRRVCIDNSLIQRKMVGTVLMIFVRLNT
jgi:hypothetical protein